MSYCINPTCPNPDNLVNTEVCQACGSKLLLRDRYRLIDNLGQGGFGATFLAKDEQLPGCPSCVIKQLRPATSAPHVLDMARDLFRREAKTLGKIGNHPQVPRLLDYFELGNEFYLVQEYVSGLNLQQEVKQNGPFTEAGVKQFLSEILPVLQYIHSNQVIHRDIKPANLIRRSEDKKLVLIDFGAVKDQVNPNAASTSEQTALTSYAIGTPGYAPPEQMAMRPVYASDIYALGITCIYLLTGRSPKDLNYDPKTGEMLWRQSVHVTDHFAEVLKKMLDISVRHRYQSANEVLRALDLEPYLESLAQGMVSQPNPTAQKIPLKRPGYDNDNTSNTGNSSSSATSSTARLAEQIRRRRAEAARLGNSGGTNGVAVGSQTVGTVGNKGGGTANTAGRPKTLQKMSAADVQSYLRQGIRPADFKYCDLSQLNLEKMDLEGANFRGSKLQGTNLQKAALSRAQFSYADLQSTDLRGANLTNANLSNAILRGANLCGANLTGATVSEAQLSMAKTNFLTIKPDGKRGLM